MTASSPTDTEQQQQCDLPAADKNKNSREKPTVFTYLPRTRPDGRPTWLSVIRTANLDTARAAARNAGFLSASTVLTEYADGAFLEADSDMVRTVRAAEQRLDESSLFDGHGDSSDAATLRRITCSGIECVTQTAHRLLTDGADVDTVNMWAHSARLLASSVVIHEMRQRAGTARLVKRPTYRARTRTITAAANGSRLPAPAAAAATTSNPPAAHNIQRTPSSLSQTT